MAEVKEVEFLRFIDGKHIYRWDCEEWHPNEVLQPTMSHHVMGGSSDCTDMAWTTLFLDSTD